MKHKTLWNFPYVMMMMMMMMMMMIIIMYDCMNTKPSSAEALKHCWYKGMFLASTDLMNK